MSETYPALRTVVLDAADARVEAEFWRRLLGFVTAPATIRLDRSADPDEALYVFADPAGHPFCVFVSPDSPTAGDD